MHIYKYNIYITCMQIYVTCFDTFDDEATGSSASKVPIWKIFSTVHPPVKVHSC